MRADEDIDEHVPEPVVRRRLPSLRIRVPERTLFVVLGLGVVAAVFFNSFGFVTPDTTPQLYYAPGRTLVQALFAWSANPLRPVYREAVPDQPNQSPGGWTTVPAGLVWIGHHGDGFAFDNEGPRHQVFLQEFQLCHRLVTNAEYLGFLEEGGYERPELWFWLHRRWPD